MRIAASLAVIMANMLLCGCVSVFEGTSQNISVNTNPSDAVCSFERAGNSIGTITNTPGTLTVRKTKYDIYIRCNKPGYQEATYLNHSGVSAAIAANVAVDVLFTGGISSIVDSATGADNKYDSAVNITMIPTAGPQYGALAMPAVPYVPGSASLADQQYAEPVPVPALRECTKNDKAVARLAQENGYRYQPDCR
jgi:uncharacterized protein YceK